MGVDFCIYPFKNAFCILTSDMKLLHSTFLSSSKCITVSKMPTTLVGARQLQHEATHTDDSFDICCRATAMEFRTIATTNGKKKQSEKAAAAWAQCSPAMATANGSGR